MKWSTSAHRPPHLYLDDAWYFVTASTVNKANILSSDEHLNLWANIFKNLITEFQAKVTAWVVLQNHYHFLFLPQRGTDLGVFMKRLNYIHYNPVKHGYVRKPEDWHFSSYRHYLQDDGDFWLNNSLQDFPIHDLFDDDKF